MKKIILVWRFDPNKQQKDPMTIDDYELILFFTPINSSQILPSNVIDEELIKLINDNRENPNNTIFGFIHKSQIAEEDQKKLVQLEDKNFHLFLIGMGEDKIYEIIDLETSQIRNNSITKAKLEEIWKYYESLTVENIKRKIINLILPLAIDFQGIRDAEETLKDAYLKEIIKESNYIVEMKEQLKNLKKEIKNIEHLMPKIDFDPLEKLIGTLKIDYIEKKDKLKLIINKYSSVKCEFFLPDWLKKAVEDIESQIQRIQNDN